MQSYEVNELVARVKNEEKIIQKKLSDVKTDNEIIPLLRSVSCLAKLKYSLLTGKRMAIPTMYLRGL